MGKTMQYREFLNSLQLDACPDGLEPSLQVLWHGAAGEWDGLVQELLE